MTRRLTALAVAMVLAVAACGDDAGTETADTTDTTADTAGGPAPSSSNNKTR